MTNTTRPSSSSLRGPIPGRTVFDFAPKRGPLSTKEKVEIFKGEVLPILKLADNSSNIRNANRDYNHVTVNKIETTLIGGFGKGISIFDNADALNKIVTLDTAIQQAEKIRDTESAELLTLSQNGLEWKVASFAITYFIWILLLFGAPYIVIGIATVVSLGFFFRALYLFIQPTLKELQMAKDFHKEINKVQKILGKSELATGQKADSAKEMIDQLLGKEQPYGKESILKIRRWTKPENREKIYQTHLNRRISAEGTYYINNNKTQLERLSQILQNGSDQEKLEAINLTTFFLEKTVTQIEVKQTALRVQLYVIYGLIFVALSLTMVLTFIPGTDSFATQRFAMSVAANSIFVIINALSFLKAYKAKEKAVRYQDQEADLGIIDAFDGDMHDIMIPRMYTSV